MDRIKIAVDMDNTLEDLVSPWLEILNNQYGLHYTIKDLKYFDMEKSIPELNHEQLYQPLYDTNLFDQIKPIPGAQMWLERLNNDPRFEIYIVTNTHYKNVTAKMEKVLFKYFPFLSWKQLICMYKKQLLDVDYLIDDYEGNLFGGSYTGILYSQPYNMNIKTCGLQGCNLCKRFLIGDCKKNVDEACDERGQLFRANNWQDIYNYFDTHYHYLNDQLDTLEGAND